jgi:hypothetical protein
MAWPWLTGTAVALFTFIMTVLSVPTTLAGNWQLTQSAVRRVRRVRSERRVKRHEPVGGGRQAWTTASAGS